MELDGALREAILDLIRNNLTVEVSVGNSWDFSGGRQVSVEIKLAGEVISESSHSLPTHKCEESQW